MAKIRSWGTDNQLDKKYLAICRTHGSLPFTYQTAVKECLILSSHIRFGLPICLFPSGLTIIISFASARVWCIFCFLIALIWSPYWYLVKTNIYEEPETVQRFPSFHYFLLSPFSSNKFNQRKLCPSFKIKYQVPQPCKSIKKFGLL